MPDWLKLAITAAASLPAVMVAALSAPVTASRFRLAQLERLHSVMNKMEADDPARPYLAADARRKSAWWAATTSIRVPRDQTIYIIILLWIAVSSVLSFIWWSPAAVLFPRWYLPILGYGALMTATWIVARRRRERVNFYNVLIAGGPHEFSHTLKTRLSEPDGDARPVVRLVRRFILFRDYSGNDVFEQAGVVACPKGHPVGSSTTVVFLNENRVTDDGPFHVYVCSRCLSVLPRPFPRDVDEVYAAMESTHRRRIAKRAKGSGANNP